MLEPINVRLLSELLSPAWATICVTGMTFQSSKPSISFDYEKCLKTSQNTKCLKNPQNHQLFEKWCDTNKIISFILQSHCPILWSCGRKRHAKHWACSSTPGNQTPLVVEIHIRDDLRVEVDTGDRDPPRYSDGENMRKQQFEKGLKLETLKKPVRNKCLRSIQSNEMFSEHIH